MEGTKMDINYNANPTASANPPKKRGFKFVFICIIVAIITIIVAASSIIHVEPNQYILIKQFGRVERIIDEPGIAFKLPFIQTHETLYGSIMLYDMRASDVITKDKKSMIMDDYVLWQITDPLKFYQSLNTRNEGERRIDTIVYNALKNYIGSMNQTDVIAGRANGISSEILPTIADSVANYGIEIVSVEIKRLDMPDGNKDSVYTRMISERDQMAATYTAEGNEKAQIIRNDTDKQVTVILSEANATSAEIEAQGESEYMRILSDAYNSPERMEFYEFMRSLDALKTSMVGDNKTLVLPINSPLTKILLGY